MYESNERIIRIRMLLDLISGECPGISIAEISRRSGIPPTNLHKWHNAQVIPRQSSYMRSVVALTDFLEELRREALAENQKYPEEAESGSKIEASAEMKLIPNIFDLHKAVKLDSPKNYTIKINRIFVLTAGFALVGATAGYIFASLIH